ncbi:hypothetical protein U1Q18_000041 [Sarracenia purpurea var. burkii]
MTRFCMAKSKANKTKTQRGVHGCRRRWIEVGSQGGNQGGTKHVGSELGWMSTWVDADKCVADGGKDVDAKGDVGMVHAGRVVVVAGGGVMEEKM